MEEAVSQPVSFPLPPILVEKQILLFHSFVYTYIRLIHAFHFLYLYISSLYICTLKRKTESRTEQVEKGVKKAKRPGKEITSETQKPKFHKEKKKEIHRKGRKYEEVEEIIKEKEVVKEEQPEQNIKTEEYEDGEEEEEEQGVGEGERGEGDRNIEEDGHEDEGIPNSPFPSSPSSLPGSSSFQPFEFKEDVTDYKYQPVLTSLQSTYQAFNVRQTIHEKS